MLKKSLIAMAVLAFAMPAFAGDMKFHDWPCEYVKQEVACIDVLIDIGFYVHILDQNPILLDQSRQWSDKGHLWFDYNGYHNTDVVANFPAILHVKAYKADGAPIKDLRAWFNASGGPTSMLIPALTTTAVTTYVQAREVRIDNMQGGTTGVKIGEVCYSVTPQGITF